MNYGSLFSGIGGFDAGFDSAGMTCAWQVEQDKDCLRILNRHWAKVPKFNDVRDCHSSEYLDAMVQTWFPSIGSSYTEEELEMAGRLKKLTPQQAEESVRMYNAGLSLQPIADYFRVSRQAMWDLLKRRTTLRPQKREGKDNHFYRGGSSADDHAQNMVEYAIRAGMLIRKDACENCGSQAKMKDGRTGIQAHHCDYNKPLDVIWFCQKCHHEWHKENQAIPKGGLSELAQVDVICGGFP